MLKKKQVGCLGARIKTEEAGALPTQSLPVSPPTADHTNTFCLCDLILIIIIITIMLDMMLNNLSQMCNTSKNINGSF